MNRARQLLIAAVVFGLLVSGIAWVFNLRVSSGDVYPTYSSLRADALGTRALHDALAEIPGLTVAREYRPITRWRGAERSLRLIMGAEWRDWSQELPKERLDVLSALAVNGSRVVIAFHAIDAQAVEDYEESPAKKVADKKKTEEAKKKENVEKKKPRPGHREVVLKKLGEEWGVTLKTHWVLPELSQPSAVVPAELAAPERTTWRSDICFVLEEKSPWRVLYQRGGRPVLIEKKVGAGSIVLMAESYPLSNESLQKDRATELIRWLIADQTRVVFAESELGVLEENGVGSLARRYGLGGALAVLLLLAALYVWRRLVEFVPRNLDERAGGETALAHEPTAGMVALLRRSLAPGKVLAACHDEWRKAKLAGGALRPADERVEAAWRERAEAKKISVTETYNALVQARKPR